MMKGLINSILADQRGDTLVETLVAILVSSLAMLMLAAALSSSMNIVTSSNAAMKEYYSDETALVTHTATPQNGYTVSITIGSTDSGNIIPINGIKVYKADAGSKSVIAYSK